MAPNHERHDVITRALRENYASISRKFTQPVYSIFLGQQERARAFSSTLWRYFLRNGLDETDSFMQLHHPALLHNLSTELHYTFSFVCLLHEQVFAISGREAEIHTGHIQQCWHTLHRWEEHGRSENIYHSHQTPPGGTPTLQRQAIFKYIGGSSSSSRVYFNCTTYTCIHNMVWNSSELIITIIKQAVHFTILLYNLVLPWLFSRLPARP